MKIPFSGKKRVGQQLIYPFVLSENPSQAAKEAYASLNELQETTEEYNHIKFVESKRAQIALKFVNWYLFYVAAIIILVPLYNALLVNSNEPIDIYKLLTQVGTLLGSPLGFVVGYYFKGRSDSNSDK